MNYEKLTKKELIHRLKELESRADSPAIADYYREMFYENPAIKILIDPETGRIADANRSACIFYGLSHEEFITRFIWDFNRLEQNTVKKMMRRAARKTQSCFQFPHQLASGEIREVEVYSGPITINKHVLLYSIIFDITERKNTEREREKLIHKLKRATRKIKILQDMLPICANCKKIRTQDGNWHHIETFISENSGTEFTHSICPECIKKLYPKLKIDV